MAKSSRKKTKVGKAGKTGKVDGDKKKAGEILSNKIEIVEEDGGDEMVIDIEMADGGDDTSDDDDDDDDDEEMHNGDDDEEMQDDSVSVSASSDNADAESNSETTSGIPIPFLDTFYALSAENANERAAAAHCLIRHCFPADSPVQAKDAAYALRRLLSGLCSGRAGARQGYASALSSFLRVAFATSGGELPSIHLVQKELSKAGQDDDENDDDDDDNDDVMDDENVSSGEEHPAEFVRKLLLVQTTPQSLRGQKAAKKGSEERDYIFGRLFGIMAVVRSSTLFGSDVPVEVIGEYARSLVKLYKHKSWVRESTAHAIMELLSGLQSKGSSDATKPGLTAVVQDIINPAIILNGADGGVKGWSDIAKSMTAEQIAVVLHIQMLASASGSTHVLPLPLSTPLLTPELIPLLSNTLRDTSSEVQDHRCHLVWNAIWMYLTEIGQSGGSKRKKGSSNRASDLSQRRTLRSTLPVGSGSGEEVIKVIIEEVIVNGLLGAAGGGGKSNSTHDRRKLALMLIQSLCGASNPRIGLPADVIENCLLQRAVVERAFINIIRTSSGGRPSQAEHTLKPMALQILNSIVDSVVSVSADEDKYNAGLRLAIAKSLVLAEPRFDGVTKTDTVTSLLLVAAGGAASGLIKEYFEFLENIIYASKPYEAIGYVNLLVALGKKSLRIAQGDGDADTHAAFALTKNLLALLLAGAFFDLSSFSEPKRTKRKGKKKSSESHPVLDAAQRIITSCNHATEDGTGLPYQLRTAMASSFFSYLADAMSMVPSSGNDGGVSTRSEKSRKAHEIIACIIEGCDVLEANGAILHSNIWVAAPDHGTDDENDASISPKDALQSMNNLIAAVPADDKIASDAAVGCSSLLSSIYLQSLSPGKPERESAGDEEDQDHMGDDENQEEMEEVNDEAREMISDVLDITRSLLNRDDDDGGNVPDDDDENPLAAFAELCVNILSSSLGSGIGKGTSRGSAAKLLRDSVKNAWSLILSYAHEKEISFEQDVMAVLVEAVCGSGAMRDEAEAQGGDDADMDSGNDESDSSDDEGVFTAANVADLDLNYRSSDDDGAEDSSKQDESDDDEEGEDVELDKDQLNDILMEDSDEDPQGILEHHAGADKALAKLIKMKQEARKAGQAALERVDIAIRMRCVVLLETALSYPSLLEDSAILMAILPILRTRRSIDKEAMSGKVGGNKDARLSEKKSLADRLSSMLQKKICKVRLTGISDLSGEELSSACAARSELATHILEEAKKSPSTIHSDCCSLSLVLTMKSLPQDAGGAVIVAEDVYSEALQEWSQKKTTKLKSSLFDVFIVRSPSLARIVMVRPLVNVAQNARSAFLKAESFRLLADLYRVSRTDESPLSVAAMKSLEESASLAVSSLSSTLQDDDMTTTKRLRDPLKATAELIAFGTAHCRSDGALWNEFGKVSGLLESLGANSKSQGVKKQCQSLVKKISEGGNEGRSETVKSSSSKKKKKKKNKE